MADFIEGELLQEQVQSVLIATSEASESGSTSISTCYRLKRSSRRRCTCPSCGASAKARSPIMYSHDVNLCSLHNAYVASTHTGHGVWNWDRQLAEDGIETVA